MDVPMTHSSVDASPSVIPETRAMAGNTRAGDDYTDGVRRWMGPNKFKLSLSKTEPRDIVSSNNQAVVGQAGYVYSKLVCYH